LFLLHLKLRKFLTNQMFPMNPMFLMIHLFQKIPKFLMNQKYR